jgi:hypothetical protein
MAAAAAMAVVMSAVLVTGVVGIPAIVRWREMAVWAA